MTQGSGRPRRSAHWFGAAGLLGVLHALSFAPWAHWSLAIASLAGVFGLMRWAAHHNASPARQAALAAGFGMGWFGLGLAWLFVSMHTYGGMPALLAGAAVVLFAGYLSAFPALASWFTWRVFGARGPLTLAAALAGSWTLAELVRGSLLTGFPWLAIGYAQLDGPLEPLAPLLGVYGVGAAATVLAALLAGLVPGTRPSQAGPAQSTPADNTVGSVRRVGLVLATTATLLGVTVLLPPTAWTTPRGAPISVRLVQGNVAQQLKFDPARALKAMTEYTAEFESSRAQLTILPETAWTVPWSRTPEPIAQRILAHAQRGHALAVGLPLPVTASAAAEPWQFTNSVVLIEPSSHDASLATAPRYDKHHLVPFGEFVPLGFRWFVNLMHIPLGDFARGAPVQAPFQIGEQRIGFNICYEDLFGEELRRALNGPHNATILANVSNIAWFGDTHALPQHLAIARMRSLETGRPMLRATNTGITAAIDARGQVLASLAPYTRGTLDVWVQGTTGLTPFARWGNSGAWLLATLLLGLAAWRSRSCRRRLAAAHAPL